MADSSNGNFSRQNKGKRKLRKESVQKRSKIHKDVEDKELFANNGLKSEFKLDSDNDLQEEEEESKHERNDDKDTPKKKRKVEFDIGDSSLINKDELTGMLNEIASGQIKKVKKIKLKRKANVNVSDRELRNSKNTFKAQGVEDGNATSKENINNTIVTSSAYPAIDYLVLWKKNRSEWSFKKSRQIWLLKNIYDETKIGNKHFKILMKYLKDLKGKSREETLAKAKDVMEKPDEENVIESEKALQRIRAEKIMKILV